MDDEERATGAYHAALAKAISSLEQARRDALAAQILEPRRDATRRDLLDELRQEERIWHERIQELADADEKANYFAPLAARARPKWERLKHETADPRIIEAAYNEMREYERGDNAQNRSM